MIVPQRFASQRQLRPAENSSHRRTILIVDDQPIVAFGLAALIEDEADSSSRCVTVERCDKAVRSAGELQPDLIIIDVACECGRGMALLRKIRESHPAIRTLVFSAQNGNAIVRRVLLAGSNGFVSKTAEPQRVLDAIRQVLAGQLHYNGSIAQGLPHSDADDAKRSEPAECLTDRELEVFTRIGHGETSRAIARELGIKVKTVDSYREKIKAKLCLQDSVQLVHRAVRWVVEQGG